MEAYVELQTIGRGAQGTVCTVRHVAEGVVYLMKRLHVVEHRARLAALREAQYLQLLQHTAVVGYRDCFIHEDSLCIVMEYVRCADAYGQGASVLYVRATRVVHRRPACCTCQRHRAACSVLPGPRAMRTVCPRITGTVRVPTWRGESRWRASPSRRSRSCSGWRS